MPKAVVDVFVLISLFAPLLLAVCLARDGVSAPTSLLEMSVGWQLVFLAVLVLPAFALRRLQLLRAPSGLPSTME